MKKAETKIQQEILVYFRNKYCRKTCTPREIMFHVPNENQHHLYSIGVMAGVSDLIFTFQGQVYFLEIKTPEGSQSAKQKDFQNQVEALGFKYFLCRSLEEFKNILIGMKK